MGAKVTCAVCGAPIRYEQMGGRWFCVCDNDNCPSHMHVTYSTHEEAARAYGEHARRVCHPVRNEDPITGSAYDSCSNCGKPLAHAWQLLPNYCWFCGCKVVG